MDAGENYDSCGEREPFAALPPAEREVVQNAFRAIEAEHGAITPGGVVEAARAASSPLHRYFEWDDTKAAASYRLAQARKLIQSVRVFVRVDNAPPVMVRGLVSVKELHGFEYVERSKALTSEQWRAQKVKDALAELERWCTRHVDFGELAPHRKAIERLLAKGK